MSHSSHTQTPHYAALMWATLLLAVLGGLG